MYKIMHCISDTNFGGAGRVLINYLNHFDHNSFQITVVVPKGSKLLEYLDTNSYKVIEFDGMYDRSYNRNDVKALRKLIKQLQPDIVHSHGLLSARIAAKKCHTKIVYTRHSVFDLPKWQTTPPFKWVLGAINDYYTDHCIAVSPAAKTLLVDSGSDPKKISVVYNGVEQISMIDSDAMAKAREHFGVKETDFVCTILARLEPVKGHSFVIQAAQQLKEQGIQDIKILIAGTGGIEDELKEFAAKLQVDDIVKFVGFIKDIPSLLSITDVQLNASYGTEATSMALLEGFSIGVPAIVSDFGGNPYVVQSGENGLVFPKQDSKALADAIVAIKNDDALYNTCSEGARKSFLKSFTAEKMAKNSEKVYYQLLGV